ncbi:MAG: histidinol-phosphatase HisJ [Candidatus Omnitrophica bacterium]|nr:histidinol-phosphatase HisJ [Candidatus Omnitrophota bacterium]
MDYFVSNAIIPSMIYADYHMHTPLCGHAIGTPEEYVKAGIKVGLKEVGFSDHAPMLHQRMPGVTMTFDELPQYHQMIEDVQKRFNSQITVKIGIEADFIPGYETKTKALINSYNYDYIIGSVHFIDNWAFDDPNPTVKEYWKIYDVNDVYRKYYKLLQQSAKSGLFDIIGHCDLPKKFGARPTVDLTREIKATAKTFKDCGVAIEINTAGLYKPIGEMYPAPNCLKIYQEAGVPLTLGSDAHSPNDVGRDFDKAIALAKSVGYSEVLTFKQRKIDQRIKM